MLKNNGLVQFDFFWLSIFDITLWRSSQKICHFVNSQTDRTFVSRKKEIFYFLSVQLCSFFSDRMFWRSVEKMNHGQLVLYDKTFLLSAKKIILFIRQ